MRACVCVCRHTLHFANSNFEYIYLWEYLEYFLANKFLTLTQCKKSEEKNVNKSRSGRQLICNFLLKLAEGNRTLCFVRLFFGMAEKDFHDSRLLIAGFSKTRRMRAQNFKFYFCEREERTTAHELHSSGNETRCERSCAICIAGQRWHCCHCGGFSP